MFNSPIGQSLEAPDHLAQALLNRLLALPFDQFAELVCRLLTALGYKDARPLDRRHFKGGHRGIGSADIRATLVTGSSKLPVLVLLKQFRRPVQARYVFELRGRLLSEGVNRGLAISTSAFRPSAVLAARESKRVPIDLIDGTLLVKLMRQHGIGVTEVSTPTHQVDERFFANLASAKTLTR